MDYNNNDSRINLAYESTDISKIIFVSLNYLSGAIEYAYSIDKVVNELANTMILRNTQVLANMDTSMPSSSPSFKDMTFPGMTLVMSFNDIPKNAFEFQFKF